MYKFLLAISILTLVSCSKTSMDEFETTTTTTTAPTDDAFQSQMMDAVNELRTNGCQCGNEFMPAVAPLSWNNKAANAAFSHALDMSNNDFFDHQGSDGSKVSERLTSAGYQWSQVGENIAWNYDTVADAMEAWKESTGHCKNLMNADFVEMGAVENGAYWVQVFARPLAN